MSSPTNERPPRPHEPYAGEPYADEPEGRPPPSTLLLREVAAHAGAPGAEILGPALPLALREVPPARCRLYVLADLADPAAAAPLAAALLETAEPSRARSGGGDAAGGGRWALLRALTVAPPERGHVCGGGLVRRLLDRLLDDLLMELRADGIRSVVYQAVPGAIPGDGTGNGTGGAAVRALLEDAGFTERTGPPFAGENHRTSEYDEPEIRLRAVWLVREL
ncbi:hypothetical protein [Microbispora triticiradicis]|uniref:SAM-dependent methyltransferase n=2 Tax=Microbispora TaxID=2005 RepID=A0ABY3LUP2_9ACTN|nr:MULTISPECIES: hypothetical protein [Microbispora]TLP52366.1 hypothetical protein FED44_32170 [Microbispora fusca]TYB55468.1 hypothetical protein FXF59_21440 [Microbispora tritici]